MNEKVKPVAKVVRGAVRIAIWEQVGQYGKFYTMSPSRSYKKGDDWMNSTSFVEDEALLLSKAFSDAYDIIRTLKAKNQTESESEEISI